MIFLSPQVVDETKFERNSSLEYYRMRKIEKKKTYKLKRTIANTDWHFYPENKVFFLLKLSHFKSLKSTNRSP